MKRIWNSGLFLVVLLGAFVLGACTLQADGDGDSAGAITISFGSVGASGAEVSSSSSADPTHARVWLYRDGAEVREDEVELSSSSTVRFESVPEGSGYTLVAILGEKDGDLLLPSGHARTASFAVRGGRETAVSADRNSINNEFPLKGKDVGSVVALDGEVFSATSSAVYKDGRAQSLSRPGTIYSVSPGKRPNDTEFVDTVLVSAQNGIFFWDGSEFKKIPGAPAEVKDVQDSGAFLPEDEGDEELVIYYSRLGGLGSAIYDEEAEDNWDWGDSEDGLEDLVGDGNPIRAMATDGSEFAYFSGVLGTFRVTEAFFNEDSDDDDFDIGELLGGESDEEGLTFFGVAYPGAGRPMRILRMGLVTDGGNTVIVGTGRGAFLFDDSALENLTDTKMVRDRDLTQINVSGIKDQEILGLSVDGKYIAVATRESIVVLNVNSPQSPVFDVPARAVSLGRPQSVYLDSENKKLYVGAAGGVTVTTVDNL